MRADHRTKRSKDLNSPDHQSLKNQHQDDYPPRVISNMPTEDFSLGSGAISGYVSVFLGVLSFLAVLCYQFPSYLTTADLRAAYDAEFLRKVLMVCMWFSLGFGLLTFILRKKKRLGAIGVLFTLAAFA